MKIIKSLKYPVLLIKGVNEANKNEEKEQKGEFHDTLLRTLSANLSSAMSNQELSEELPKQIIKKFEKRKGHSSFTNNIWSADLADMQLISKFNKAILFDFASLIFIVNMHGLFL